MSELEDLIGSFTEGIDALKSVVLDAESADIEGATLDGVIELVALRGFSLLETYLEEVFYLSMLTRHDCSTVAPVLPVSNRSEVSLLIYSGGRRRENYLTWLPYEVTADRADSYLEGGQPNSWLRYRPVELAAIKELTVVRNAVAHPSDYAFTLLLELADEKGYQVSRPADYLKSLRSGSTEVLLLLTQVSVVAHALAKHSEIDADAVLQPGSMFQAEQKAPAGTFYCSHCQEVRTIEARGKLGSCPNCGVMDRCSECGRRRASTTTWVRQIA